MEFLNLQTALNAYADEVRNLYQDKLILADKIASGDLLNSIDFEVQQDDISFIVSLKLEKYWKYIEGGSKGTESSPEGAVFPAHFPPTGKLLEWIRVKPVIPKADSNGKIPTPQSLAYLIGRKIKRLGIKPVPALQETLDEVNERYIPVITEALAEDVGKEIATIGLHQFMAIIPMD